MCTYWGMIHAHSYLSDGMIAMEDYFPTIRGYHLDFGASSDHDHEYETSDEDFKIIRGEVKKAHDPVGGFLTLLGYEWAKWNKRGDGDKCVYFRNPDELERMFRSGNPKYDSSEKLYSALEPFQNRALIIPHHTAYQGNPCSWEAWDPVHERLVEIFSVWGCSERSYYEGNPKPVKVLLERTITPPEDRFEAPEGFIIRALRSGIRLGFTAGGDDHIGHPGGHKKIDFDGHGYQPGLVGVFTEGPLTEEALWSALWNRRTFGTTGARILGVFSINGYSIGSEIHRTEENELVGVRSISYQIVGDAPIDKIEIVRNGENWLLVQVEKGQYFVEGTREDRDYFHDIAIRPENAKFAQKPFIFYFLRVTLRSGQMAWFSPIWID